MRSGALHTQLLECKLRPGLPVAAAVLLAVLVGYLGDEALNGGDEEDSSIERKAPASVRVTLIGVVMEADAEGLLEVAAQDDDLSFGVIRVVQHPREVLICSPSSQNSVTYQFMSS